jgi:hypothetical protein
VATYTANVRNAQTTANAYITLYGSRGDSGRCCLDDSLTHQLRFLKGQVDVFVIEAVHLGQIEHVDVEHDGKDAGG